MPSGGGRAAGGRSSDGVITVRVAGGGDSPERSEIVDVEAGRLRGGDRALGRRPSGDLEAGIRSDSAVAHEEVPESVVEGSMCGDLANWGLPEADAPEALLDVDGEEGSRGADCSALEANPHEVVPHGDVVDGSAHEAEAHEAVRDALGAVRDADGEEGVLGDLADCSAPEADVHEAEADAHEAALDADG